MSAVMTGAFVGIPTGCIRAFMRTAAVLMNVTVVFRTDLLWIAAVLCAVTVFVNGAVVFRADLLWIAVFVCAVTVFVNGAAVFRADLLSLAVLVRAVAVFVNGAAVFRTDLLCAAVFVCTVAVFVDDTLCFVCFRRFLYSLLYGCGLPCLCVACGGGNSNSQTDHSHGGSKYGFLFHEQNPFRSVYILYSIAYNTERCNACQRTFLPDREKREENRKKLLLFGTEQAVLPS